MAPPIRTRSQRSSRLRMSGSLSVTFEPPRTATNGCAGLRSRPSSTSTSRCSSSPARGGQPARDPLGGGVGAVGGAERVVDVVRVALREPVGEGRVVLLLLRVEAEVLEHHQLAGAERRRPGRGPRRPRSRAAARPAGPSARPGGRRPGRATAPTSARPSGGRGASRRRRRRPASSRCSSVGTEARMRASSVTRPSSSGTFRSARTSTRAPRPVDPRVVDPEEAAHRRAA